MKTVLLWGWIVNDCRKAVERAVKTGHVKVAYWIADSERAPHPFISFLYRQPDFGRFQSNNTTPRLSDRDLVKFLEMFSREKRAQGLTFHEQSNIAKNYFRYFCHILTVNKVDHAIFELIPLTGLDYICYVAAKTVGVRTTLCYQSNFPSRFFYCHDLDDFGHFREVEGVQAPDLPEIAWGYRKNLHYMNDARHVSRFGRPWSRFAREVFRYGWRTSKKPVRMSGVVQSLVQGLDYEKSYRKLAIKPTTADLERPFVYFPLHLQPEMSTTGLGGRFSDQLDAIEELSKLVPRDWRIYIKENPYQGCEYRGIEFYNRLKTIPQAKYMDRGVDTYALMERCKFVATVTGTAGWEAVTGGKPCLVFGLAWYMQMPGVVQFRDGLALDNILGVAINRDEQIASFRSIYEKSRSGILDPGYCEIAPQYNSADNIRSVADFIADVVQSPSSS
jgi:hypothetical protein